jgi:6-pyruvoyltetrahydropterin/6-carboxytetrahydropterin synthase
MPRAYLTRRYLFSASHRLHSEAFSDDQNREIYGKCNNRHGHGHNYHVEITVSGQVDASTGMVCNLVDLDSFVQREVLDHFDTQNLNTLPQFGSQVPTTENLCTAIYEIMRRGFTPAHLERVRIEETMMNSFEYAGDREALR